MKIVVCVKHVPTGTLRTGSWTTWATSESRREREGTAAAASCEPEAALSTFR